jgi:gamma-glutamylcyclotransferase (GGCT)/AIG2-like uncharacterized protein YtfP
MKLRWFAFYGSLRKGMVNHQAYEPFLNFHFNTVLSGYKMFALPEYPYVIKSHNPNDSIVVEVHEILDEQVSSEIHEMEISVGYEWETVLIGERNVLLYYFREAGNEKEVKGGDWVKFFGRK